MTATKKADTSHEQRHRAEPAADDVLTEVPKADAAEQAAPALPEDTDTEHVDESLTATWTAPDEVDPVDAGEQAPPEPAEDDVDHGYDGTTGPRE